MTAQTSASSSMQKDQRIRDFIVTQVHDLPEINSQLVELKHEKTGAEVMHLQNDDPENLFNLCFKTYPASSDGVAHILEHTVLCGSKKFPVKDPFFSMTRRSLNTFMNALTGSDFTCYPAASQVPKDFYNLLEVYLDAAFFPNLRELSFSQEGHRLEFEIANDPATPLMFKGVVFNEMKGAMSSPVSRMYEALGEELYPDITYRYNSGGNPREIPNLTYQGLLDFHQTYYHPSRCIFFFYGNMPLEPHLEFIEKHVLNETVKKDPIPPIPQQKRFSQPKTRRAPYPFAPGQDPKDKSYISMAWLTCSILNQDDAIALQVLDSVLMDTDASPLRHALLESGLCKGASSAIDTDASEIPFIITCTGCEEDKAAEVEKVILSTLKAIVEKGIEQEKIESALHQLELQRSEILGDSWPYGLMLCFRSALIKQHGGSSASGLAIHSIFARLRKSLADDPQYFTKLIKRYFIDNPHRVTLTLFPDLELMDREALEEKKRLEMISAELTPETRSKIVEEAVALEEFQLEQAEISPDCLPKVTLDDVPEKGKNYPLNTKQYGELAVHHHSVFTNKIVYANLITDLPEISEEDLPYLGILMMLIPQVGSGGRSYTENLDFMHQNVGALSASVNFHADVNNPKILSPSLHLNSKALYQKSPEMFQLLKETYEQIDLTDKARLNTLLSKHFNALYNGINSNAMGYALGLSAAHCDSPSRLKHKMSGLEYFLTIREINLDLDNQLGPLINKLQELKERLFHGNKPQLVLGCDSDQFKLLEKEGFYGLDQLKTSSYTPWKSEFNFNSIGAQGRFISSPVSFTGYTLPSAHFTDSQAAALGIAANLFDNKSLHPAIREKGGAYGGGTKYAISSGLFSFYAYRDPNLSKTLNAFEQAIQRVIDGKFSDEDLEEAKLEVVQDLDDPTAPGSRALLAYNWMRSGKSFEVRQKFRNQLLSCTKEEVIAAVKQRLQPIFEEGALVAFSGKEMLERENPLLPKPLPLYEVNSKETLA